MPETPVVAFVIPVYQKPPEVFKKCLDSLFDQSLKAIEVVAVFDGPDQELEAVAGHYPSVKRIVVSHGGASRARNIGFKATSAPYVAFWDADCYIKPDAAKRWMEEFKAVPDADFVYSGYELAGERGGYQSEPFDAYSLTSGNFVSSMACVKREKVVDWDETLEAAQDWDFWLSVVEAGAKGAFIPGSGFVADALNSGISSKHWTLENREKTLAEVRERHEIPYREIGVYSMNYSARAVQIAKALGADVVKQTGRSPDTYKMLINLGYGYLSRFDGIKDETVKIQYWVPGEIEAIGEAKYSTVKETVKIAAKVKNLCGTLFEKNKLAELGIEAEVLPLPILEEELAKAQSSLPEKFSVLVLADEAYGKLLTELEQDLPHIQFGRNAGAVKDYSCVISFFQFATLDEAILTALVNGRNVISNVQAPCCGFVDPSQTWDKFKSDLYEAIREAQTKPFNQEAKDHYLEVVDPRNFKRDIEALLPRELEVVA